MTSFDPEEFERKLVESLKEFDLDDKEIQEIARKQVNNMGIYRVQNGTCPIGAGNAIACTLCKTGHATECHHPYSCEEANCGHYQAMMAQEG